MIRTAILAMALTTLIGQLTQAQYTQVYPKPKEEQKKPPVPMKDAELEKFLEPYLTKDGNLTSPVVVRNEKKGFGIFWGVIRQVNTDGSWSVTFISMNQPQVIGSGKLSKDELKKLAIVLAENEILSLPNLGTPLVNPHVITIQFGGRSAFYTLGVDLSAPVPATPVSANTIAGRYGAVSATLEGLINQSNGNAIIVPPPRSRAR